MTRDKQQAAYLLCQARLAKRPIDGFPAELRPETEEEAYEIQTRVHESLIKAGLGPVGGHKIGCTTPVMQKYMNIDHPCAGGVLGPVGREFGDFRYRDFVRPGVECEVAVRLGADLAAANAPHDRESVAAAVSACMAAIEVVDDRYVDYAAMPAPMLVADDFFAAGCVLGVEHPDIDPDMLADVTATMWVNDENVGTGRGDAILGHPLEALAWLANRKAESGESLAAGEFVLLGSVVQCHWVEPGDDVRIENDALGSARVRFRP